MFAFRHVYLHNIQDIRVERYNLSSQISMIVCLPKPEVSGCKDNKKNKISQEKKSKKIKP